LSRATIYDLTTALQYSLAREFWFGYSSKYQLRIVSSFAKDDVFAEEGLTLLPDGTVYDNGRRVYHPPGEIGPGMLRPDGTVFWSGAACDVAAPPRSLALV
jgi:hypothetical protein